MLLTHNLLLYKENIRHFLLMLQSLESPHPREIPFFVDGTATTRKMDTVASQAENELALSEISQPDEKQSTVSEQKPNSPEQPTEVSQAQPASVPPLTKAEEKARQPVVLNPVPHQQVQQPHENKPVSAVEDNQNTCKDSGSAEVIQKSDQDLVKEMCYKGTTPNDATNSCCRNYFRNCC